MTFETWLSGLPALGYDPDWIRRNGPALHVRYQETGGAPMERCPAPPVAPPPDRYEEI